MATCSIREPEASWPRAISSTVDHGCDKSHNMPPLFAAMNRGDSALTDPKFLGNNSLTNAFSQQASNNRDLLCVQFGRMASLAVCHQPHLCGMSRIITISHVFKIG